MYPLDTGFVGKPNRRLFNSREICPLCFFGSRPLSNHKSHFPDRPMWALIGSFTRIYPIDFSSPPATLGFPQAKKEGPLSFPPAALFHLPPLLIAGTFHR